MDDERSSPQGGTLLTLQSGDTINEGHFITYTGGEFVADEKLCRRAKRLMVLAAAGELLIITAAVVLIVIIVIHIFSAFLNLEADGIIVRSGENSVSSAKDGLFLFILIAGGLVFLVIKLLSGIGFFWDSLRNDVRLCRFAVTDKAMKRSGRSYTRWFNFGQIRLYTNFFQYGRVSVGDFVYCAFIKCDESESWFVFLGRFAGKSEQR